MGRKRVARKLFESPRMLPLSEEGGGGATAGPDSDDGSGTPLTPCSTSSAPSLFQPDGRFSSEALLRRNDSMASLLSDLQDNVNKIWCSPAPLSLYDIRLLANIESEQDVIQRLVSSRAHLFIISLISLVSRL